MESAVHAMIRSMAVQLMASTQPALLRDSVRQVAVAGIMAAGVAMPAVAQNEILPKGGAGYWGSQFGGTVAGEVVRGASTGSRALDRVMIGVATDVGRTVGRRVVEGPAGQVVSQVPKPRVYVAMSMRDVDQLDTLALRAAFSYDRLQKDLEGRHLNSAQYRAVTAPFQADLSNFKVAYRMMEREGKDVRPWEPMSRALGAHVGSISVTHLQNEGAVMLSRLQRPGGPGFVDMAPVETLDGLRQRIVNLPQRISVPQLPAEPDVIYQGG